jgi:hypothetical protein
MLFFILDDLVGIKLWGENIFRRVLHHLSTNNYNDDKKILIHRINNLLKDEIVHLQNLNLPNYNRLNTSIFAKYHGNYSKRSTLYFNDFDEDTQKYLLSIAEKNKPIFENILNEKLELGDSDFKIMILRYEGKESKFSMHYDTEHEDCYRSLILYKGEGIVPPFCFIDDNNNLIKVHLNEGDGIIFKGTQTYHGVFPSGDDNTIRYMLGFQYKKIGTKEKKSLCSELRGKSYYRIFLIFLPYFIYYNILSLLDNKLLKYIKSKIKKKNYKFILTSVIVLISVSILFSFNYSQYYGTKIAHSLKSLLYFYIFLLLFTFNSFLSFILLGYFLITEMIKNKYNPSNII